MWRAWVREGRLAACAGTGHLRQASVQGQHASEPCAASDHLRLGLWPGRRRVCGEGADHPCPPGLLRRRAQHDAQRCSAPGALASVRKPRGRFS